jgi:4-aminobutyrate aminotransferase-like enzyme
VSSCAIWRARHEIVGDVRGTGYFWALELVKDRDHKVMFDDEESERLLRGFLSTRLLELGLICRADDRDEPVIQLSPPLIATGTSSARSSGSSTRSSARR